MLKEGIYAHPAQLPALLRVGFQYADDFAIAQT